MNVFFLSLWILDLYGIANKPILFLYCISYKHISSHKEYQTMISTGFPTLANVPNSPHEWFQFPTTRHYILCYPPSRATMAAQIAREVRHASVTKFDLNAVTLHEFPDGEPNILVPHLHELTGRDVLYLADWSGPAARYKDLCILTPIAEMIGNGSLTIVVPFFGSATMERETVEGSVATANVDAKLLSQLPGANKRIIAIDLHTTQNQFFFHNCVVSLKSCMPFARSKFAGKVIAFPDEGAKKRFSSYFADMDQAVCAKVRDGDARHVRLTDGAVAQRDVVIIDDLVRSGGTLIECAKALKAAGADEITVFVPHACFPNGEYRRFIGDGDGAAVIDKFLTTDSVAKTADALRDYEEWFEVLSLGSIIKSFFY